MQAEWKQNDGFYSYRYIELVGMLRLGKSPGTNDAFTNFAASSPLAPIFPLFPFPLCSPPSLLCRPLSPGYLYNPVFFHRSCISDSDCRYFRFVWCQLKWNRVPGYCSAFRSVISTRRFIGSLIPISSAIAVASWDILEYLLPRSSHPSPSSLSHRG